MDRGRVVQGVKFVRNPAMPAIRSEIARRYDTEGADEITFLDITASSRRPGNPGACGRAGGQRVFIPLTVGGGIRVLDDVRRMLNASADKVSINTAAIARPEFVREGQVLGNQCRGGHRRAKAVHQPDEPPLEIFTHGGRHYRHPTPAEWARPDERAYGAGEITDQHGPRRHQTRFRLGADPCHQRKAVSIPVIASGEIGTLDHLADGILLGKADAVLAASIFHFAEYTIEQAKHHMRARGIEVVLIPLSPSGAVGTSEFMTENWLERIKWTTDGLVPAIAQDADSGRVLMMAWMNRESLQRTVECGGRCHWSRSRQQLWQWRNLGNTQKVRRIRLDCDTDVLLLDIRTNRWYCLSCRAGRAVSSRNCATADGSSRSDVKDPRGCTARGRRNSARG